MGSTHRRGKVPEGSRECFGVDQDQYTPEQREAVRTFLCVPYVPAFLGGFPDYACFVEDVKPKRPEFLLEEWVAPGWTRIADVFPNWDADALITFIAKQAFTRYAEEILNDRGTQRAAELFAVHPDYFFAVAGHLPDDFGEAGKGPTYADRLTNEWRGRHNPDYELLPRQKDAAHRFFDYGEWDALLLCHSRTTDDPEERKSREREVRSYFLDVVRQWVSDGLLPADFSTRELLAVMVDRGLYDCLTPMGRDMAAGQGLFDDPPKMTPLAPVADVPEPEPEPEPLADKGKRTLADEIGVKAWHEIEAACTLDGLRFKRKGAPGRGRMFAWDALGLAKSGEGQRLLMDLAASTADGIASPGTNARRVLVSTVSKRLRGALGLEGRPLENVGGMRTRARFRLAWEGPDRTGERIPSDD